MSETLIYLSTLLKLTCLLILTACTNLIPATYTPQGETKVVIDLSDPETPLRAKIDALGAVYGVADQTDKLLAIIHCESSGKAHAFNRNKNGSIDFSYFQINSNYWANHFYDMGLNIYDPEDNLKAGVYLYSKQGDSPWSASKKCWSGKS